MLEEPFSISSLLLHLCNLIYKKGFAFKHGLLKQQMEYSCFVNAINRGSVLLFNIQKVLK